MESGVPNSFIPQDATVVGGGTRHASAGLGELILLIAIVSFITSAATGVAIFLYSQYISTQSTTKLAELQRAKDTFDPAVIDTYTRMDDRMNAADSIMKTHIAPTAFFTALNQLTLKTISFKTLNFDTSNLQDITIKATGVAHSVNSVALQADILSKSGIIKNPIFSNINRGDDGVDFNLTADIDSANLNYEQLDTSNGIPTITPTNGGTVSAQTQPVVTGQIQSQASSTDATTSATVPSKTSNTIQNK